MTEVREEQPEPPPFDPEFERRLKEWQRQMARQRRKYRPRRRDPDPMPLDLEEYLEARVAYFAKELGINLRPRAEPPPNSDAE